MLLVELAGGGEQFFDIRQPLFVLFAVGVLERLPVAGFGEHEPDDFFDRTGGRKLHSRSNMATNLRDRDRGALGQTLDHAGLRARLRAAAVPVRSACSTSASMVVLPMPRGGVLMIRRKATSSRGLFSRCRYASTSLISLRW